MKRMRNYRKKPRPGNRGMTVAEQAYVTAVKRRGCICCLMLGYEWDDAIAEPPCVEAHHVLDGGLRQTHYDTLGLCLWHHKGRLLVHGWSHADHRKHLGPSLAEGATPFELVFGDQITVLLPAQEALINDPYYELPTVTLAGAA